MLFKLIECAVARAHPQRSRDEIKAEVLARHNEIGHSIAQRFSRGNVNIQNGAFLTREDLNAKHKELSGI
jgi:hypothetical protein